VRPACGPSRSESAPSSGPLSAPRMPNGAEGLQVRCRTDGHQRNLAIRVSAHLSSMTGRHGTVADHAEVSPDSKESPKTQPPCTSSGPRQCSRRRRNRPHDAVRIGGRVTRTGQHRDDGHTSNTHSPLWHTTYRKSRSRPLEELRDVDGIHLDGIDGVCMSKTRRCRRTRSGHRRTRRRP
jgi:hypothetical protein